MSKPKIDNETFVKEWVKAHKNGLGVQHIADSLSISKNHATVKANYLRGRGVQLPRLYTTTPDQVDKLNAIIQEKM